MLSKREIYPSGIENKVTIILTVRTNERRFKAMTEKEKAIALEHVIQFEKQSIGSLKKMLQPI